MDPPEIAISAIKGETMQDDSSRDALAEIRTGGCLQPFLEGFAADLLARGYAILCVRDYGRAGAHLGRWMDAEGIELDRLTGSVIDRFGEHCCRCSGASRHGQRPSRRYVARVRRFGGHLRSCGMVPSDGEEKPGTVPPSLEGFRVWMRRHRGAAERTIDRYEVLIRRMLPSLGSDPALYDASRVREVLLSEVRQRSSSYAKGVASALRAFLRFLAAQGRCRPHLDRAVPAVREWKLSALPRYLEPEDVERVIASCDLHKPEGVRDRAVLLLLARLGLRAGDVVAMRLDDLDWRRGTLRVRGKGHKEVRLPLPQDAGDALAEYLATARPSTDHERVFLCANAPVRPFSTSSVVSTIVCCALERAGIADPPSRGAHLLRHSAATAMLRAGASLDAVATVLRHQSADMTAYYAKVDLALLQLVVQPWPDAPSC
jgi:integrase/recombinase XerD